jgi:hypothetical protein
MRENRGDRDLARGYTINYKLVFLAYAAETVIVIASLVGAWLFSQEYGQQNSDLMTMMMLAPIAYAVVEFCRVPLAISIRTQTSFLLRGVAVLGVLGAGCVTIKSMSQLGEIMFRPRLFDVVRAREQQQDAQSTLATFERRIADADALVAQRKAELDSATRQLATSEEKLKGLPAPTCLQTSWVNKDGVVLHGMRCSNLDPRIATLTSGVSVGGADLKAASARLESATAERKTLDRTAIDSALRNANMKYREAVMHSQLHSFAAMLIGKDPTEVTDGEIHQFLRIFVFVPAIGAAFAATLIALMAVNRLKPLREPPEIADDAASYILEPFAEEIIRESVAASIKAAQDSIAKARDNAKGDHPSFAQA